MKNTTDHGYPSDEDLIIGYHPEHKFLSMRYDYVLQVWLSSIGAFEKENIKYYFTEPDTPEYYLFREFKTVTK